MINVINMKYDKMLEMTKFIHENKYFIGEPRELKFLFSSLDFIEPAGAIIFLSTIDKLNINDIPHEFESIDHLNRDAVSYGETIGVFQELGLSEANSFDYGKRYIAPTKVLLSEVHQSMRVEKKSIETYYDEVSSHIVNKALQGFDYDFSEDVNELFEFVVREMIRNIFDHSKSIHFYYGSQMYPANNCVEVVIADLGEGLLATVPFDLEDEWHKEQTDEDAIRRAMIPGLTARSNHSYAPEVYKNSGYGLSLVQRIIQKTDGIFSIASGEKSITFNSDGETVDDCNIKGTLIRLRIKLRELEKVDFKEILIDAQKEAIEKGFLETPSSASKRLKSQRID